MKFRTFAATALLLASPGPSAPSARARAPGAVVVAPPPAPPSQRMQAVLNELETLKRKPIETLVPGEPRQQPDAANAVSLLRKQEEKGN